MDSQLVYDEEDFLLMVGDDFAKHLPGKHDQSTHGHGGVHTGKQHDAFWLEPMDSKNYKTSAQLKNDITTDVLDRMTKMGITGAELRATIDMKSMPRWEGSQPVPSWAFINAVDTSTDMVQPLYAKVYGTSLIGQSMTFDEFTNKYIDLIEHTPSYALPPTNETQTRDKTRYFTDLTIDDPVLDRVAVAGLVRTWAQSSNNEHPIALAVQEVAKTQFNLKDTAGWKTATKAVQPMVQEQLDKHSKVYGAFLQSQYDATQEFFKAKGITELTLYRGVKAKAIKGFQEQAFGRPMEMAVQTRPLSSWSGDLFIAHNFATRSGNILGNASKGYIMREVIPVSKILSTPFTGNGCYNEKEIVTLGGISKVDVAPALANNYEFLSNEVFDEQGTNGN